MLGGTQIFEGLGRAAAAIEAVGQEKEDAPEIRFELDRGHFPDTFAKLPVAISGVERRWWPTAKINATTRVFVSN